MTQAPGKRTARPGAVLGLTAALSLSVAACGGNLSGGAAGGEFPSGPITIAVGQDPGGSTDLIARALAEGLTDDLGVAAPVVNTPAPTAPWRPTRSRARSRTARTCWSSTPP
ncbi:hypothetical protein HFP72_13950 [Nocardiopsis sp. ARC36]